VLIGTNDGCVKQLDLSLNTYMTRFGKCELDDQISSIICMSILENKYLVCGLADGLIKVFDLTTDTCVQSFRSFSLKQSAVTSMCVCSNGLLISGYQNGYIKAWNLNASNSRKSFHTIKAHFSDVKCLEAFENGANRFVSTSKDASIKVWSADTFELLAKLIGHTGHVNCVKIKSNGDLVSGSCDCSFKVCWLDFFLVSTYSYFFFD
jgi:WD40 repeat protein